MFENRSHIGMAFSEFMVQRISELYCIMIKLPSIKLNCQCFFQQTKNCDLT